MDAGDRIRDVPVNLNPKRPAGSDRAVQR